MSARWSSFVVHSIFIMNSKKYRCITSILLLDKNLADDFAFCSLDTRRLDIEELTVCHYLQNIRQLPRNLGLHSKDRLLINQSPPIQLVTAIFDSFNDPGSIRRYWAKCSTFPVYQCFLIKKNWSPYFSIVSVLFQEKLNALLALISLNVGIYAISQKECTPARVSSKKVAGWKYLFQ